LLSVCEKCGQTRCFSYALPEPPSFTITKDCAFGSFDYVCSFPPDLEPEWFCGLKTRYALVRHPPKNANETHEIEFLRGKKRMTNLVGKPPRNSPHRKLRPR